MTRKANIWKNKIVGYGEVDLEQVLANPDNWRIHPKFQQEALAGVLNDVGIVQNIIINKRTDPSWPPGERGVETLVDGHLRVQLGLRHGQKTLPATYVDLTPEEEREVLATLDPIAALAVAEEEKLKELLQEVQPADEAVQKLLADLVGEDKENDNESFETTADDLDGAFMLKPDMRFESTEIYGIPPLRADRLAACPENLRLWPGDDLGECKDGETYLLIYSNTNRRLDLTRTYLAFYTDDVRFESAWTSPDRWAARIINAGLLGIVAPNFSLWTGQAQAVHIWNVYRSRWLARYFQEAGIYVIPDLNWSDRASLSFCFAGIPNG